MNAIQTHFPHIENHVRLFHLRLLKDRAFAGLTLWTGALKRILADERSFRQQAAEQLLLAQIDLEAGRVEAAGERIEWVKTALSVGLAALVVVVSMLDDDQSLRRPARPIRIVRKEAVA